MELVLLAISLSLDSFIIGTAYRLRGIWISVPAKGIIGGVSGFITLLAVTAGKILCQLVSADLLKVGAALILIIMGVRLLFQKEESAEGIDCDRDHSEHIDAKEAVILGLILSVDSLGAGTAAAIGSPQGILFLPVLVVILNLFFLCMGGKIYLKTSYCVKVAGIILILVGLLRLLIL